MHMNAEVKREKKTPQHVLIIENEVIYMYTSNNSISEQNKINIYRGK